MVQSTTRARLRSIPRSAPDAHPRPDTSAPLPLSEKHAGGLKRSASILKDAASRWVDDGCYRLGASLAYYALFSIFPLLLVAITILGFFLGSDPATRERLLASVAGATSAQFRDLLDQTLAAMQAHQTARGVGAAVGIVTLFFGASGAFSELEFTMNKIWRVQEAPSQGFGRTVALALRDKAISFAVVAGAALLLLLSLFVSTALSALGASAEEVVPNAALWRLVELGVSLGLVTGLFAVMFRMLPQTAVAWRDVLGGALLTAVLFSVLKHVLAWYLSHLGSYAAYGAVGAVLGLMTWIYLASLCLFFGAEVTRVYAEKAGSLAGKLKETKAADAHPADLPGGDAPRAR